MCANSCKGISKLKLVKAHSIMTAAWTGHSGQLSTVRRGPTRAPISTNSSIFRSASDMPVVITDKAGREVGVVTKPVLSARHPRRQG